MSYKFTWNKNKLNSVRYNAIQCLLKTAFEISTQAQHSAPVDSGALVNSIRVTHNEADKVFVLAGGGFSGKNIPYAKKREYENRKNPHKRYYMKNAFAWGEKNFASNFKGVTK